MQLSALGRAPGADAHNNGRRRQLAAPGALVAKRTDDKRTQANRQAAEMVVSTDACRKKQEADMAAWVEGLATSAVLPTRFFGLLLGNFEATHARAVSPRSRRGGLQRESYGGSKGTPKQTDSYPICSASGIICAHYLPLILGIKFSTIWRVQIC